MAGKGGYQAPGEPAPVSGPGALSARTDGGPAQAMRDLPNARYGENAAFRQIQSGAPMASAPSPAGGGGEPANAAAAPSMLPPTLLSAPSERPDEPVTAGVPTGPGPSSMQLPSGSGAYVTVAQRLSQLAQTTGNPDVAFLAGLAGQGRF